MNTRKRVLIGGAGGPNYGDELIVRSWLAFIRNFLPNDQFHLFENNKENSEVIHGTLNPAGNIHFHSAVEDISKSVSGLDFWEQVLRGYSFLQDADAIRHAGLEILLEAHSVHLHGGGYLNEMNPEKGFWLGLVAAVNKRSSTRCFATGIGFGPVAECRSGDSDLLSEIMSRLEIFELRDFENFRFLKDNFDLNNLMYGLDDSFLIDTKSLSHQSDKKSLFLSFISYNVRSFEDDFWDVVNKISSDFDEVLFCESYPWEDAEVIDFLKDRIPQLRKLSIESILHDGFPINRQSFAITARFHTHLSLSRSGCPGLYVLDSKYYKTKHQSIMDIGSGFQRALQADTLMDAYKEAISRPISLLSKTSELLNKQKKAFARHMYRI